jgi:serine protease
VRRTSWTGGLARALGILALASGAIPAGAGEIVPVPVPTRVRPPGQAESTGEVLVKFREGVDSFRQWQILGVNGARVARAHRGSGYTVLQPRWGATEGDTIRALRSRWEVAVAEPNYLASAADVDPYFYPYQWNLFDRGVVSGSVASNYGINAASAWNVGQGVGVKVALLDTGCAYANYQEYRMAPDLGAVKITPGWDFINNDGYPNDDNGHGTHVATTLVSAANDGVGVAGVAPGCTIMPIKVLDTAAYGSYENIAGGIRYAADQGAQIINLSLNGTMPASVLAEAVQYATNKGCLLIAAAGNEGQYGVGYPARYSQCIAVGATRFDGQLASYSNRGWGLSIVGPGGDTGMDQNKDGFPDGILAQTFDPKQGYDSFGYYFYSGTSMATPQVAGVAALALSLNPRLGRNGMRYALLTTATDLGSRGWDGDFGYGLVNAMKVIEYARKH